MVVSGNSLNRDFATEILLLTSHMAGQISPLGPRFRLFRSKALTRYPSSGKAALVAWP